MPEIENRPFSGSYRERDPNAQPPRSAVYLSISGNPALPAVGQPAPWTKSTVLGSRITMDLATKQLLFQPGAYAMVGALRTNGSTGDLIRYSWTVVSGDATLDKTNALAQDANRNVSASDLETGAGLLIVKEDTVVQLQITEGTGGTLTGDACYALIWEL